MKHVPHLVVAAPWEGPTLDISVVQWRHLTRVLRMSRGDAVTYTDGLGMTGEGRLGNQSVARGDESQVDRPRELTVAVAPPDSKDRQRFLVEKLAEMGVAKLVWLATKHGRNRPPNPDKVFSWVLSAVEQSRGAWLMETVDGVTAIADLEGAVVMCKRGGGAMPERVDTLVIGPEGGFSDDELELGLPTWDLGPNVLRVETAAVVAAARVSDS